MESGTASEVSLTSRQREVMELLCQGRTNPEIAERLGISLAGAKWHVSEVLSRLGVGSREEAVAVWKQHESLRQRLSRRLPALVPLSALKLAGTAAGVLILGGTAVAVMMLRDSTEPSAEPAVAQQLDDSQARDRARYLANEYLKQTDVPQKVSINGQPLTADMLNLVSLVLTPDPGRYANGALPNGDMWEATFRREGLAMPDMGWTDGVVVVEVGFDAKTGKVRHAGASRISKALEDAAPPPGPTPDPSLAERVTPFYPVTTLDQTSMHTNLSVYGTRGGDWCWAFTREPDGGGGSSCWNGPHPDSADIFAVSGTGQQTVRGVALPAAVFGATSERVDAVLVMDDAGIWTSAAAAPFPPETGLSWRAFAIVLPPGRSLASIRALDTSGAEIATFVPPRTAYVPPYVVAPLSPIAFAGNGPARGGEFRLPPPAFPVTIALRVAADPGIQADIACDTAALGIRFLGQGAELSAAVKHDGDRLLIGLPPDAQLCHFEVTGEGSWSFATP
jgi:DNA-binding CsgD family transcriptional regulator